MKYHALEKADVEKGKRKKEEKMLRLSELTQARESERAKHYHNIDVTDHHYSTTIRNNAVQDHFDTSPLLLDAVVTPMSEPPCALPSESAIHAIHCREQVHSAREQRDKALGIARHYRDLAESRQLDKRILKNDLEGKIETVRDFWRNKIVEGGSRSGQILRNALMKK